MSLRITAPPSAVVRTWRAPLWARIAVSTVGALLVVCWLWSYAHGTAAQTWFPAFLVPLVGRGLREKLTLTTDAVVVRGMVLTRVIPIDQVSAVEARGSRLVIRWGDGRVTWATAFGGQAGALVGPDANGLWHTWPALVLATRDAYLERHGLTASPVRGVSSRKPDGARP